LPPPQIEKLLSNPDHKVRVGAVIRLGDVDDTFRIADILAHDPHDVVQKAVGGWVREAGKKNRGKLLSFLEKHAATMPRTALRYAVEKLEDAERRHYLGLRAMKKSST